MRSLLNGCTTQTHYLCGEVKIYQKTVDIFPTDWPGKSLGPTKVSMKSEHKKEMTGYIKKPHTTRFTGQTNCGKTHLVLELIEKEHNKYFDYVVIIIPTLRENFAYHGREWMQNGHNAWLLDPKGNLY